MNIKFITVILASLFLSEIAIAERAQGNICNPRVPTLEYEKAINIANNAIANSHTIGESFIDLVMLECINNVYQWKVGFRNKAHESGHFIVYVLMDGSTKTLAAKDG